MVEQQLGTRQGVLQVDGPRSTSISCKNLPIRRCTCHLRNRIVEGPHSQWGILERAMNLKHLVVVLDLRPQRGLNLQQKECKQRNSATHRLMTYQRFSNLAW
jgi:hypothetical protein